MNERVEGTVTFGRRSRRYAVAVGDACIVDPINPRKKKHRGRLCEVVELEMLDGDAWVKFIDTGRTGKVDIGDLVSAKHPNGDPCPEFMEALVRNRVGGGPHDYSSDVGRLVCKWLQATTDERESPDRIRVVSHRF